MFGSYFFDQNAHFALFPEKCTFPPPSDPSAPALMFSQVKSMIWGEKSALFREKCTFCTFPTLGTKKSCEFIDQTKGWRGDHIIGELFAPKCTLGALGAHWVPAGPGAGWLAEARAEARGKG